MSVVSAKNGLQETLERKQAELVGACGAAMALPSRKAPIKWTRSVRLGRELALRNVDRDSTLLRQVKAALLRIQADNLESASIVKRPSAPSASPPSLGDALCPMPGDRRPGQPRATG